MVVVVTWRRCTERPLKVMCTEGADTCRDSASLPTSHRPSVSNSNLNLKSSSRVCKKVVQKIFGRQKSRKGFGGGRTVRVRGRALVSSAPAASCPSFPS
eukprot:COSAG04_NODE_1801_length_5550_cov_4.388369_7_plen_99_part_00